MQPTTKLRWALLGTARINRAVIPVLQSSERNTLVAVASRDLERARSYATQWNIPRALAPYESVIADPDVDAIYISLPNSLHADWTSSRARRWQTRAVRKATRAHAEGCGSDRGSR
jgi:predicted dehydrogenase